MTRIYSTTSAVRVRLLRMNPLKEPPMAARLCSVGISGSKARLKCQLVLSTMADIVTLFTRRPCHRAMDGSG